MINKVDDFLWYFFARQFKNHEQKRRKKNFFDIKSIKFLISLIRHKKATPQKNAFAKILSKKRNLL